MALYDKSFRTPQATNLYFSENKVIEIKKLLLQTEYNFYLTQSKISKFLLIMFFLVTKGHSLNEE